ncbi:ATP-binding cassette domain-containing protein [bacterium]|nr:MAG: ATP-binding cassette domain-containing protein [bacterium]
MTNIAATRRGVPYAIAAASILAVVVLPFVSSSYVIDVATTIITFAVLGLGLNIVVGYAGLLDLGYAAFFAIGAYTTALLETLGHQPFWVTLPFSILFAAISGIIIGYPTLRLRSDYLAIVTLGFGEITRIVATNLGITGGPNGIYGIASPTFFGHALASPRAVYELGLGFLAVVLVFTSRLTRTRLGRAWISIREDETAAEAIGIPTLKVKMLAYVMGAVVGGFGGSFFAARFGAIDPTSFTYLQSVTILIIVVLGGMGSTPGVMLGAAIVAGLPEALRFLQLWREFVFAIGLVVLMLVRPQGMWPAPLRRRVTLPPLAAEDESLVPIAVEPGTSDVLLEVDGLSRNFGGVRAVNGVRFGIRRGEILSIIGPNGAGKTTVFNCLTGVIRPTSGRISWLGSSIVGLAPHRVVGLGLSRTFQGVRLFANMTVYENVLVGMEPRYRTSIPAAVLGLHAASEEDRRHLLSCRRLLRFVGLEERAGERAGDLPYGDQRRLEIARALASEPRLLLLDEPAAGMNPTEKRDLMGLIRRIRDGGITVVLIEHDMMLVMGVSDRIIVMDHGEVIAEGTPAEVQRNDRVIDAYLGDDEQETDGELRQEELSAWDS